MSEEARMSENNKKIGACREVFSGADGRLSSMRIMMMVGLVSGLAVMLANTFGWGACVNSPDYSGPLTTLFAGIFGGKAFQSYSESKGKKT